jgi:hypothetical protein
MGQVDLLLAALAEELFNLVAATGKGDWPRRRRLCGYWFDKGVTTLLAEFTSWRITLPAAGT